MSDGVVRIGRGKTVIPLRVRNPERSALIRKLWDDRIRSTYHTTSDTQTAMPNYSPQSKQMAESYCEALLPFKDDLDLRADYVNVFGGIRFGKVLEDLDAMAATVAYLHCGQSEMGEFPMTILTASVDRIELQGVMPADVNLRLRGMVTWVGHSSMEISLGVDREDDIDSNPILCNA
jgi:acyl-coenzyme A thioesterase 9